jgi:myosin heavy subunit
MTEETQTENQEGIVTSESSASKVKFVERELTEEELKDKKLQLMHAENYKDKQELAIAEMEAQLDAKIPLRFLEDDIAKVEKDIESKSVKDDKGNVKEATEADLDYMKIRLNFLRKTKELDLPMRELRFSLLNAKIGMDRVDSPSKQIKKLEKEIRERRETTLAARHQEDVIPVGVG